MFASLLSCSHLSSLACGIETCQALSGKPVVDGFHRNVLHVPVVLDRIHIEMLDRFRLKPSDSRPFFSPGERTISLDGRAQPRPGFRFDNGWRGMRSRFDQRRCRATVQAWANRHFRPPSCGSLAGWSACLLDCRHGRMSLAGSSFRRQRQMARTLPRSDAPTSFASLECRMGAMDQYVRRPIRATGLLALDLATLAVSRG